VRNHPLFQPVFYELHRLDLSLAGKALPEIESAEQPKALMNPEHKPSTEDETKAILTNLDSLKKQYRKSEPAFHKQINQLQEDILICIKDMHLLDIEEKHHLKRMVSYDLPNLLETYDSLSEDQKEKTFDEVMSTVNSMRDYVKKQTEQLQSSRMDRMKHLLKLNEVRYNNSSENVKKDAE
jgi:gas vesicle protein